MFNLKDVIQESGAEFIPTLDKREMRIEATSDENTPSNNEEISNSPLSEKETST